MKLNKLLMLFSLGILTTSIVSCGETPTDEVSSTPSQESSSVESESSIESSESSLDTSIVANENYSWPLQENAAYTKNMKLTTSSVDEYRNLKLKIDGSDVTKANYIDYSAKIMWEHDEKYPVHSDTLENCANDITFNDVHFGRLPTDYSKGVTIPTEYLDEGYNIFSVTIGRVYVQNQPYNMNEVHGGLNGAGDDYKIRNMRIMMPDGQLIKPAKMVLYKPVSETSTKYVKEEVQQIDDEFYWLGDGWGGSLSYAGHSNPRLDIPFRIDFYFEIWTPGSLITHEIDTTKYTSGLHTFSMYDEDELVLQNNVYFDNDNPVILSNVKDNGVVNQGYKVECEIKDPTTEIIEKYVKVDGKKIEFDEFFLNSYLPGKHNMTMYAKDSAGNETYSETDFAILANSDTLDVDISNNQVSVETNFDTSLDLRVYQADKLNYLSTNPLNSKQTTYSLPVDEFEVSVNNNNKVYLTYKGETLSGERLNIEALNVSTNQYERIALANSNEEVRFLLDPTNYNNNGKVKIKVTPLYVGNGSNRMLWSSDTQYLPKVAFTDINYMYNDLMKYVVKEYNANKTAYLVHTGDIVDNNPDYGEDAIAEWEIATKAFDILDAGKVPYGVSAGNHDVGTTTIIYDYYATYFGMHRFYQNDHFGGSINDNECHYDLITVGEYDFIVLYLGYGIENEEHTVAWANKVLKMYPHRNAIIATHAYLTAEGGFDEKSRAEQIYNNIVVPNENVKFVFCGHTDGNAVVEKVIGERKVYEILNCYQFVEKKKYSVSHKISGMNCNGEGFIKELVFEGNTMNVHTFSPITNDTRPLNAKDDFSLTVDLIKAERELTSSVFEAYQVSSNNAVYEQLGFDAQTSLSNLDSSSSYVVYVTDTTLGYGFSYIN